MTSHRPRSFVRCLTIAAGLGVCLTLGACQHGAHTSAGITAAQDRLNAIKAGTEWDMARQAYLAGDLKKAMERVDKSIALNGAVPKSYSLRGRILLELGDFDGAVESLLKAEALDPGHVDAQYYLAIVHERVGDKPKALERYQKAADLDPENPQYAVAATEMMIDTGDLAKAEEYLVGRQSLFQHNAGVRQTLGHIAMIKGEPVKAAALFNEARLLAPEDPGIVEDLVRAQLEVGQFAEADYNLNQLMTRPENAQRRDLQHMRARCLVELDRPVEAREILIHLTTDAGGARDADAWIALGNVSYTLRDMNRLRMSAGRVIAIAPQRAEGYMLRAVWFRQKGELAPALRAVQDALQRDPQNRDALLLAGLIHKDLGQLAQARSAFGAALRLDPEDAAARRALSGLDAVAGVPAE